MDGNQRWSEKNNKTKLEGYTQGLKKIEDVINYAISKKIRCKHLNRSLRIF